MGTALLFCPWVTSSILKTPFFFFQIVGMKAFHCSHIFKFTRIEPWGKREGRTSEEHFRIYNLTRLFLHFSNFLYQGHLTLALYHIILPKLYQSRLGISSAFLSLIRSFTYFHFIILFLLSFLPQRSCVIQFTITSITHNHTAVW